MEVTDWAANAEVINHDIQVANQLLPAQLQVASAPRTYLNPRLSNNKLGVLSVVVDV